MNVNKKSHGVAEAKYGYSMLSMHLSNNKYVYIYY